MAAAVLISQVMSLAIIQSRIGSVIAVNLHQFQKHQAVRALRSINAGVQRNAAIEDIKLPDSVVNLSIINSIDDDRAHPRDEKLEALLRERAGIDRDVPLFVRFVRFEDFIKSELPAEFDASSGNMPIGLLFCAIEVAPDRWAAFYVRPLPRILPPSPALAAFLIVTVTIVACVALLVAIRLARPLRALADAAQRLTVGQHFSPVPVVGSVDVRRVQTAFNVMGARLQSIMSSQQALLAAIGHDLRTPLTALRLRAELLADAGDRERITRALDELERLTEAALEAASSGAVNEPTQRIDLAGLVSSVCEDLADLRLPVAFEDPTISPIVTGWPDELARAVRNIVENAVRYGGHADVRLAGGTNFAKIIVCDTGPGIPEADLERVFEPLVRLESSRNLKTGGHGMGLHIARNTILSHRGEVRLKNRPGGGLEATIVLPCQDTRRH